MPRRGSSVNRFKKGRVRYDKSLGKPMVAYTGKCPLCGDKVTKAQMTVQKHVGGHIQRGELAKEDAGAVVGKIYSYRGDL